MATALVKSRRHAQSEKMHIEPPHWPSKLSREERRLVKERERAFQAALKSRARQAGWRYAGGWVFRQVGEWFVSNLPFLAWRAGVRVNLEVKPMALDPLFWEIVGLAENNALPLSFRANGAWTISPSWRSEFLAGDEASVDLLADEVLNWSTEQVDGADWSIGKLLEDLGPDDQLKYQKRTLAICLHLLNEDLERAQSLTRQAGDQSEIDCDSGGFGTNLPDGSRMTFNQQALEWIANERRRRLALAIQS